MKNATEQKRPESRPALETLEKMSEEPIQEKQAEEEMPTKKGAIIAITKSKYGGNEQHIEAAFKELNRDLRFILSAEAEGEAEEKMEGCQQEEGMWTYLRIHLWFTRTTAQGRHVGRAGIMSPTRFK